MQRSGKGGAEACTSATRKIGEWLVGARGYLLLEVLAVAFVLVGGALPGGGRLVEERGGRSQDCTRQDTSYRSLSCYSISD